MLEFFRIDCTCFDGLVVTELWCFYLLICCRSTGTGFIITFAFVGWTLFPFSPVESSFEPFITYTGLSKEELIFFRIVVKRFLIPCYFLNFYLSCSFLASSFYFYCISLRFFRLFYCAFLPWNELFNESQIEFKEVLWASLPFLFLAGD